jgi:hypothetical protein
MEASAESVYGFTERHRAERVPPLYFDAASPTEPAEFVVTKGVGQLTVFGAKPGDRLTLIDDEDRLCVTLKADEHGQANFAFVPGAWGEFDTGHGILMAAIDGHELVDGTYTVLNESTDPPQRSEPVVPLGVGDLPDPRLYEQELRPGLNYIEMRDGVRIAAAVHLPPEPLYGPGPYPTVVEYSGYAPSNPEGGAQTSLIMPLLGFAVVGVNMRGTGPSGGVYDVFSRANRADGYDVIETVARQSWVLGSRVGMVGLSYPGIAQLITAATQPPSLCAIAPMSVIDDPWRQQWPGGVYNSGFTREWLHARDAQSLGGQGWELALAEAGDDVAAENLKLRGQDVDFEVFARCLEFYPPDAETRRIRLEVPRISVPVFLTGAWQDEQTGARFALMLDQFSASPVVRFTMFNGHHPDGFHPSNLLRLFEFLSFYVARRVPRLDPMVRALAPAELEKVFYCLVVLEADRFDRFADDEFGAALAAYEAEPPVRVILENGSSGTVPGAFGGTAELGWSTLPPAEATVRRWGLASGGVLADSPDVAGDGGESASVSFEFDPEAGQLRTFAPDLGQEDYPTETVDAFIPPNVPFRWEPFPPGREVTFVSAPAEDPFLICGPGHVDLWCLPGATDMTVAATISLVIEEPDSAAGSDGGGAGEGETGGATASTVPTAPTAPIEVRVQGGCLRLGHSAEMAEESSELWPEYTFTEDDFTLLKPDEWIRRRIPIPPVVQLVRAGARLRLSLHTPGRDCALWAFEAPENLEGSSVAVGIGGAHASSLCLATMPAEEPEGSVDYRHLRGQIWRPAGPQP